GLLCLPDQLHFVNTVLTARLQKIFNRISCVINCLMFRLFSSRAGAPQKVKLVDRGKRSAIIFCRMRVLHKTCYVPLSTGQVTAHPPTRKQH
ncbi:hypothetical protein, partial [Escherichia coli]|uniref:hypothetical protein n=1 Tax=Escherichia coli TaxID=562 RepID=UPI0019D1C08C